ncbi:hypothetical protein MN202_00970 [Rheinheimera muenzenbergensis]|uniref:Uncharacterized protein n=1 Tax=Rheinheimera muenzenbergensis TaxID=1193628 RepID=A0ABU8C1L8_9GAMM
MKKSLNVIPAPHWTLKAHTPDNICLQGSFPELDNIPSAVRAEILRKRFLGQTRSMALNLITSLRIEPLGVLLVPVCGVGSESDNTEAVLYWVRRYACCASCIRTIRLHELQRDLLRFLIEKTGQEYIE